MKVMMICNTDGALYVFRGPIIAALLDKGVDVSTVSSASSYFGRLAAMGVNARQIEFDRHSISFLSNAKIFFALMSAIRSESPDIVHCFTHKPAIFGTLAAKICGVNKIFVTVTGLGTLYATNSIKNRVLRFALRLQYRLATRFVSVMFFQNPDDRDEFVGRGVLNCRKARLTGGSGVDISRLALPTAQAVSAARNLVKKEVDSLTDSTKLVVLPARAVAEKGVVEFYEAARLLNSTQARRYCFVHIGLIDDLSTGAFSAGSIIETGRRCGVHFLGFKDNVLDYLSAADIVALPSYREGMPRSLLEALALGKVIVATDVPGCRETVRDGWNGFLCTPGSAASLADAISKAAGIGEVARERSRELAEQKFDSKLLVDLTLKEYGVPGG